MHPVLRRIPPALALTVPLVVTGMAATGLPALGMPTGNEDATDPHAEMSGAEHGDVGAVTSDHDATSETAWVEPPLGEHDDSPSGEHDDMPATEHDSGDETPTDHGEDTAQPRPRTAVLSAFAGVNGAVLGAAALLRRRDRATPRHRPRTDGASPTPTA